MSHVWSDGVRRSCSQHEWCSWELTAEQGCLAWDRNGSREFAKQFFIFFPSCLLKCSVIALLAEQGGSTETSVLA